MSTKIYNGIRFADKTMEGLHRRLVKLGPVMRAKAHALCRERILFMAAHRYDQALLDGADPKNAVRSAIDSFSELALKAHRNPEWSPIDFKFSVVVFPHRRQMYGMHFGCRPMTELFLAESGAQDFHYQDQSDRDESVTARQWTRRRRTWESIFEANGTWTPAEVGATYEMVTETPTWNYGSREEFAAQIPVFGPDRMAQRIREALFDHAAEQGLEAAGILQLPEGSKPSDAMQLQGVLRKWLETPKGQAYLADRIEQQMKRLPETLTIDHLWPLQTAVALP